MSTTSISLMKAEQKLKALIDADPNILADVLLEPYETGYEANSIGIFRRSIDDFDIITIGRTFALKPIIDIECSSLNLNSMFDAYVDSDDLTEKVIRLLIDNKTLGTTFVKTSRPASLRYRIAKDQGGFLAVAQIALELTMYYQ